LCDLLATTVETMRRTGTSTLAQALIARPLVIWTPSAWGFGEPETVVMPCSSS